MEKKIQELNNAADPSAALRPEEAALLTELFGMLSTNNTTLITAQHVSLVATLISRWHRSQVFPCACMSQMPDCFLTSYPVIDLLRLVLASNSSSFKATADKIAVLDALFTTLENETPWEVPLPKPRETNLLLVLRAIANMFQASNGPIPAPWTSKVNSDNFGIKSILADDR